MKEETLIEIGLSKNEAKTYLALLELGSSPAGKICDLSKIHRTNVYDSLERLTKKGLVSYIVKDKTKYFEASEPKNLIQFIHEKEQKLQDILPELDLSKKMASSSSNAKIFEGIKPIKDILNHLIELKEERYVLGAPKIAHEKLGAFLIDYHKRRIRSKQILKEIYNYDSQERIKYLNSLPYTEARYLPAKYSSPVATTICKDEVVFILWDVNPISIQIKNKLLADSYKNYFNILWQHAK